MMDLVGLTKEQFVSRLRAEVPEFSSGLDEHGTFQEVPVHLLLGDVVRACEAAWQRGDRDFLRRVLILLNDAWGVGDDSDYMSNAVSVSFVEDIGPWDESTRAFIDSWPIGLRREATRLGYVPNDH